MTNIHNKSHFSIAMRREVHQQLGDIQRGHLISQVTWRIILAFSKEALPP